MRASPPSFQPFLVSADCLAASYRINLSPVYVRLWSGCVIYISDGHHLSPSPLLTLRVIPFFVGYVAVHGVARRNNSTRLQFPTFTMQFLCSNGICSFSICSFYMIGSFFEQYLGYVGQHGQSETSTCNRAHPLQSSAPTLAFFVKYIFSILSRLNIAIFLLPHATDRVHSLLLARLYICRFFCLAAS